MCLQLRYGENLDEVLQLLESGGEWICPVCRDICNCSICRTRKHWAPTGILAPYIQDYPSVAHYLVNKYLDANTKKENTPDTETITEPSSPLHQMESHQTDAEKHPSPEKQQSTQELHCQTTEIIQKKETQHTLSLSSKDTPEETPPQKSQSENNPQDSETETSDSSFQNADDLSDDGDDVYPVERVVAHRCVGGGRKLQYRVRWKGYPPESDTWEPEENLSQCQDEINEYWVGRFGSIEPLIALHKKMKAHYLKRHITHK